MVSRGSAKVNLPLPLLAVQRVSSMKILGVTIREDLRASSMWMRAWRDAPAHNVLFECSGPMVRRMLLSRWLLRLQRSRACSMPLRHVGAIFPRMTGQDLSFLARMKRMGFLSTAAPGVEKRVGAAEHRPSVGGYLIWLACIAWNIPPKVRCRYDLRLCSDDEG